MLAIGITHLQMFDFLNNLKLNNNNKKCLPLLTAPAPAGGAPGKAGKSSWDMVNSLVSMAGCFTMPTA